MSKIAVIHYMFGYPEGQKLIRRIIKEVKENKVPFTDEDLEGTLNMLAEMDEEEYGYCEWKENLPWYEEED
jgi:effector-binding domain-containing protein